MSEMVERVARALYGPDYGASAHDLRTDMQMAARRAIKAMRDVSWERTPAILDAGFAAMREGPVKEQTQRLWHAGIDEALK